LRDDLAPQSATTQLAGRRRQAEASVFTLMGIGMTAMAVVFLVLGLVALIRCDRAAIPETVRALSSWLGHQPGVPSEAERA
jgi:hypothetical protein